MKKIINPNGYEYEIVDTKGDYTLLKTTNKEVTQWVVAWHLKICDEKATWGQGYYYNEEEAARKKFNKI